MLLQNTQGAALGTKSLHAEVQLPDIEVQGEMPRWLTGTLLRNGPAAFEAGEHSYRHWFDGLAMLHRFTIADGRVAYANRFLRTKAHAAAAEGSIGYREFATDPCRTRFQRVASAFTQNDITDNAMINVGRVGDRFVAMSETPMPIVFDPRTLQTLGVDERPPGQMPTAHPQYDPASGAMINAAVHLGPRSSYRLYSRPAPRQTRRIATIPARRPAYLHSFGMTENFLVLALGPLTVDPLALAFSGRPFIENYRWDASQGSEFIAVHRGSGEIAGRWQGDAFFVFHHINAYESGDELVVDLCAYDDTSLLDDLYLDRLRSGAEVAQARPRRYRLPMRGGAATHELLADVEFELPRINDDRNGRPYGVAWGASRRTGFADALARLDVSGGSAEQWHVPGCHPGEPVFVARPGGSGEDDGVLLSVVLDAADARSFLLVLDARSMQEVARARLPHHIPFGIHGQFYGDVV